MKVNIKGIKKTTAFSIVASTMLFLSFSSSNKINLTFKKENKNNATTSPNIKENQWLNVYDVFGYKTSNLTQEKYGDIVNHEGKLGSNVYLEPMYSANNWSKLSWNGGAKSEYGGMIFGEIVNDDSIRSYDGITPGSSVGEFETNDFDRIVSYNLSTFENQNINSLNGSIKDEYTIFKLRLPQYIDYVEDISLKFDIFDQYFNSKLNKYVEEKIINVEINGVNSFQEITEKSNRELYSNQKFKIVPRYFDKNSDGVYSYGDTLYSLDLVTNWDVEDSTYFQLENIRDNDILLTQSIEIKLNGINFKEPELLSPQIIVGDDFAKIKLQGDSFGRKYNDFQIKVFDEYNNEINEDNIINDGNGVFLLQNLNKSTNYHFKIYYHQNPMDFDIDDDGKDELIEYNFANNDCEFKTLSSPNFINSTFVDETDLTKNSGTIIYNINDEIFNSLVDDNSIQIWYEINNDREVLEDDEIIYFRNFNSLSFDELNTNTNNFVNFGYSQNSQDYFLTKNTLLRTNYDDLFMSGNNTDNKFSLDNSFKFSLNINLNERSFNSFNNFTFDYTSSNSNLDPWVEFNKKNENGTYEFEVYGLNSNSILNSISFNYEENRYFNSQLGSQSIVFPNASLTHFTPPQLNYYVINQDYWFYSVKLIFSDLGNFNDIRELSQNIGLKIGSDRFFVSDETNEYFTIENINSRENSFEIILNPTALQMIERNENKISLLLPYYKIDNKYLYKEDVVVEFGNETQLNVFETNYNEEHNFLEVDTNIKIGSNIDVSDFYLTYKNEINNNMSKIKFVNQDNTSFTVMDSYEGEIRVKYSIFDIPTAQSYKTIAYGFDSTTYEKQVESEVIFDSKYQKEKINEVAITNITNNSMSFSIEVEKLNDLLIENIILKDSYDKTYSISDGNLSFDGMTDDSTYNFTMKNLEANKVYDVKLFTPYSLNNAKYEYQETNYISFNSFRTDELMWINTTNLIIMIVSILLLFLLSILLVKYFVSKITKNKIIDQQNLKLWTHSMINEENDIIFKDDTDEIFSYVEDEVDSIFGSEGNEDDSFSEQDESKL